MYGDPSSFEELAARVADLESALDPQTLRNSLEYTTNPRGLKDTYRLLVPSGQTSPWVPLVYSAGFSDFGGGFAAGAAAIDSAGCVRLRGLVLRTPAPYANGDVLATLPAGYRPLAAEIFVVTVGNPTQTTRLDITTAGTLLVSTSVAMPGTTFLSLAGIRFFVK